MTIHAGDTVGQRPSASSRPGSVPTAAPSFRHEALLYEDFAMFLDATLAFIEDGLKEDAATLVAVSAAKIEALRTALGAGAGAVAFADMAAIGANPARVIPAWSDFVAAHSGSGRPLRGIGEPIWVGRTPAELAECHIHESLLNLAFGEGPSFWLLCPYDTTLLDAAVLGSAHRNHAFVQAGSAHRESACFSASVADLFGEPLPPPPPDADALRFTRDDLSEVRCFVARHASAAGFEPERAADLLIAINELATNSVIHGEGTGTLIVWREGATLLCEVTNAGTHDQPLAGRVRPTVAQPGGRGLWLVNQLCDLVQVRTLSKRTVVRVHQHLAAGACQSGAHRKDEGPSS
jgi:anti-sigma regulatory factor (Ser/Thr protein kinase)